MGHQEWAVPIRRHQGQTLPKSQAMTRTIRVWLASPAHPISGKMKARVLDQAYTGSLAVADTVRRLANGTPKANQEALQYLCVGTAYHSFSVGKDTV